MSSPIQVIVKPEGYPLATYGTDSDGHKCLVFYNHSSSIHLLLEPLKNLEAVKTRSVSLDCVYWRGKKKVASTRLSASVTPASDDPARLAVTVHMRSVVVFTYRDPLILG